MRATRALVGAFGAGVSLAIASSILLLIVSSVVAFRGWPDDLNGTSEPDVASLSEAPEASTASGGATAALALPQAAVRSAATSRSARVDPAGGPGTGAGQTSPSAGTGEGSSPSTASATPSAGPATGGPVHGKTDAVGQVTDVVRDTTGAVGDAVDEVAGTVDDAVGKILP
jgi:hypothetical protein